MTQASSYLTFDTANQGTLFSQWSTEDIPNAMAKWTPGVEKKVPAYVLKTNRRTELVRGINTGHLEKFYEAYAGFIKQAHKYKGSFVNLDHSGGTGIDTLVSFLTDENRIIEAELNQEYQVDNYRAVAVMNMNSHLFRGVKTVTKGKFVDTCNQTRSAAALNLS